MMGRASDDINAKTIQRYFEYVIAFSAWNPVP
jgi:hypothetical protein